jgi:hypothetical protein
MGRLLVEGYLREIERLRRFSGSAIESVVSEAFKDLLKAWSRSAGLKFVPQHEYITPMKTLTRPDGAILHDLCLGRRAATSVPIVHPERSSGTWCSDGRYADLAVVRCICSVGSP